MTMTRNLSIDRTRSRHRKTVELPGTDRMADPGNPEQNAASTDMVNYVKRLMLSLPEKQRSILQLRDIEGYSYQEIADVLNISMSQVKIGIHRARLFLKQQLTKAAEHGKG